MVTVTAYLSADSLATVPPNCDTNDSGNRQAVEILLDQGANEIEQVLKEFLALKISPPPGTDEVDNGDRTDYRHEENRLLSYHNWPNAYIQPADLASAGFYFTGSRDRVRCFECRVEFNRWEEGDDPMVIHQRWSGRCRFIRNVPCGNVPLGADPNSIPAPEPRDASSGPYSLDVRMDAEADSQSAIHKDWIAAERPRFPMYATYQSRLETFHTWPVSLPQSIEQLVEAGLFYTGISDNTMCHQCGIGLRDWEPHDDPWVQHAKWKPDCPYLRVVKGQEFVDEITSGRGLNPPVEEDAARANPASSSESEPSAQATSSDEAGACSLEPSVSNPRRDLAAVEQLPSTTRSVKPKEPEKRTPTDATICKICYSEELGVVFVPCGHIISCVKCAPNITACSVCRQTIDFYVRAFFS